MTGINLDPSKLKILIADDIPANIEVLLKTLEPEGYALTVVTQGKMVLEIAPRLQPDLILLDVMMPGINGFQTCRRLKEQERTRDIPVVFISGKGQAGDIVEGFRVGGVDYITKPFQRGEILSRIKTQVELGSMKKSQKKQLEELKLRYHELEKLDEIKTRFIGNAICELKNPLTSITDYSDLCLKEEESYSTEEKKELIQMINKTSKDLLKMVDDLKDISIFESDPLSQNPLANLNSPFQELNTDGSVLIQAEKQ